MQQHTVRGVATNIRKDNGYTVVQYHSTDVVKFDARVIMLNTGGWKTMTTKVRMNQASNQYDLGYGVYQKKGEWFIDFKGEQIEFSGDTITLER